MINSSAVLKRYKEFILRPIEIIKGYRGINLRMDIVAGLTVAVVAIPQSMAYASIAGLPPSYGLYTAGLASIVGSLWGSSRFLSTGPTNAISILVLSILMPIAAVGSEEFMLAASIMAVMVGIFCIAFALSGLSFLVNFASRAVLIGFIAGAALLIAVGQLKHVFRIDVVRSPHLHQTLMSVVSQLDKIHWISLSIGLCTILTILLCNRFSKNFPGSLIAMVGAGVIVAIIGVDNLGVVTVGNVSPALPKFATFSLSWLVEKDLIREMVVGALAVAALGLVEAVSIARELARQSGQRLDVGQVFMGQGFANIISGLFGGYACSGSFTRSTVSFQAGARSQLAGVFTGLLADARLIPLRLVIEQAESLPRDCPIVLISRSGRRCHRAMSWLLEMGFDRVYRLKGGILSWKAYGKPIKVD